MRSEEKMPLISIIVPIYKVEAYLDKCINSIVQQSYHNLEILLVDDGSPDRCGEICDRWAVIDTRIRVIHKINGGLSDARNAGINQSNGEYLCFVDSDDILLLYTNMKRRQKRFRNQIRYIRFQTKQWFRARFF